MAWLSFCANIVDAELLYSMNLALDHLRAFSVLSESRRSRACFLSVICCRRSGEGDWLYRLYSLSSVFVREQSSIILALLILEAMLIR